ncbi:MAG: TetR/AcrR family transcriptional regulator [Bacteroidia bacterium]
MTKQKKQLDTKTEAKIKIAARLVFHRKGFAATRTRDIAEEAGINLALLNYYFRSKEKLFELIMFETMIGFMQSMASVFNDEKTTFVKKIELLANNYIDLITKEPEMPLFILSEMRSKPDDFYKKMPMGEIIMNSVFITQFQNAVADKKITESNPLHFMMNFMGLIVFPFAASPLLKKIGNIQDDSFNKLMQERKKKIPIWIKAMLKAK